VTRGRQRNWNSRFDSQGHVGIPLASADFVDSIPMIARLLKELGPSIELAQDLDTAIVTQSIGSVGLFYMDDARTAEDQNGRKIIADQDFVLEDAFARSSASAGQSRWRRHSWRWSCSRASR
jgi:hypothetical protein